MKIDVSQSNPNLRAAIEAALQRLRQGDIPAAQASNPPQNQEQDR